MREGFLNLHVDFLSHTKNRHWSRQVNLLLYLNQGCHDYTPIDDRLVSRILKRLGG